MRKCILVLMMIVFSKFGVALENDSEINIFMEITQVSNFIEDFPVEINDAIEVEKKNRSDAEFDIFIEQFKSSWDEDEVNEAVVLHLKPVSKSDLLEIISWNQSVSALKINDLYRNFELPSDQSDAISYMNEVISNPLSKEREKALKGLVESKQIVEISWLMMEEILGLMKRDLEVGLLDVYLKNLKSEHVNTLKYQWFLLYSYVYKDIPTEEINDFLKYYESDIGQLEKKLTFNSIKIAIDTYVNNIDFKR